MSRDSDIRRRRQRRGQAVLSTRRALIGAGVATAAAVTVSGIAVWRQGADAPLAPAPATTAPQAVVPAEAPTATRAAAAPVAGRRPTATPTAAFSAMEQASVAELRAALDGRGLSVRELVQASLDRIADRDTGDLGLGSVIEVNPEALEIAAIRDEELARGESRGPLHGIPVLVKDLLATADGMATTAGSVALLGNPAVRDATLVARLREAGAIVLGKTNMTEWSNFMGTVQTSGWSARGGQTRNPYRLDSSPWGSSSGSAVAVAAGLAPLAIGVETDGSITCPASATSVVAMKPTVGLTSRTGIIPISFTQDSPGPMGRSVADVAALLTVMAGYDPTDPSNGELGWSAPAAAYAPTPVGPPGSVDYTRYLDREALRGARIGVARDLFREEAANGLMDDILPLLIAAGATVIDPVGIASVGSLSSGITEYQVLVTEFRYGLEAYFATHTPGGSIMSIADLVAFNNANADQEMLYHDQAVFLSAMETGSIWDTWYRRMVESNLRLARDEGIDATIAEHRLDALIAPSAGPPTLISLGGDNFTGSSSQLSAMAGYPVISVPLGYVDGLPVGLSFMGAAFSDATLIGLGYAFEQLNPVRQAPEFRLGTLG